MASNASNKWTPYRTLIFRQGGNSRHGPHILLPYIESDSGFLIVRQVRGTTLGQSSRGNKKPSMPYPKKYDVNRTWGGIMYHTSADGVGVRRQQRLSFAPHELLLDSNRHKKCSRKFKENVEDSNIGPHHNNATKYTARRKAWLRALVKRSQLRVVVRKKYSSDRGET